MAQYLIESPHTKEECLAALDELATKPQILEKFAFGCAAGEHTGYGMVEAQTESAAKEMVPSVVREKARVHPLSRFTVEQIQQFHKGA
jgi:hypothetical protein